MRRIKLVLAVLAVMVTSLAAFAGPAMADDLNCRDARGFLIRCDHQLFAPVNRFDDGFFFVDGFNPFFDDNFFPFGGGIGFDIDQEIGDTGDVTLNTTVS